MGRDHMQAKECSHVELGLLAMFWVGLPATMRFYKHQTKKGSSQDMGRDHMPVRHSAAQRLSKSNSLLDV